MTIALYAVVAVSLIAALSQATATTITGIETLTATPNAISIRPGSTSHVNFTLNLTSGYYTYGTQLLIQNSSYFVQHNIFVAVRTANNVTYGNPNMSGFVYMSPGYNTTPGFYRINLTGMSAGVQIVPAIIELWVSQGPTSTLQATTTSVSTTSTSTTTTTAASTTIAQGSTTTTAPAPTTSVGSGTAQAGSNGGAPNNKLDYEIAGIAVVIVLVVVFIMRRGRGKSVMPKPAKPRPQEPDKSVNAPSEAPKAEGQQGD